MMSGRSGYNSGSMMSIQNKFGEFDQEPKLILRQEKKYEWSKEFLMKTFDDINNLETYKNHLNDPNVKLWLNEKGTPFYNKMPLIKTVYIFDPKLSLNQVVRAIHSD